MTDGESDNNIETITQAKRIKDRGINIVSIGIGNLNEQELIEMASSANDVYKVEDFDKIISILSSISRTACQQPAVISEEKEIRSVVEKDTYKYFKFSLETKQENESISTDKIYLEKFTIELEDVEGQTNLYTSFDDENPKDKNDYIVNEAQTGDDFNFIEKPNSKNYYDIDLISQYTKSAVSNGTNKKYFQVNRPPSGQNEILYFGVKGYKEKNEFQVYVYNRTVNANSVNRFHYQNFLQIFVLIVLSLCPLTIFEL